jgi:hypothetical protein
MILDELLISPTSGATGNTLATYLAENYCSLEDLACGADVSAKQIEDLIDQALVPGCSYEVTSDKCLKSFVFGSIAGAIAPVGRYFAASNVSWIRRALDLLNRCGPATAHAQFDAEFEERYVEALRARMVPGEDLPGVSLPNDKVSEETWRSGLASTLKHFRAGTYGVCVRDCDCEDRIARKEIAVERLSCLTNDGTRRNFAAQELSQVRLAICEYNAIAMPFSPLDYPMSSRKRLIAGLLPIIGREAQTERADSFSRPSTMM